MATLKQAMEDAKQNPQSDRAKKLYEFIVSGSADEKAKIEGIDLTKFGRPPLIDLDEEQVKEAQEKAGQLRLEASKGRGKEFLIKHGSTIGMLGGSILGGPTGLGVVGAGAGAAAGEAVSQKLSGEELQPKEIAIEGAKGAAIEVGARGAMKLIQKGVQAGKPILESVFEAVSKPVKATGEVGKAGWEGAKRLFGISDDTIKTIKSNPTAVERELQAIKETGEISRAPLVNEVKTATQRYEQQVGKQYADEWQKLLESGKEYSFDKSKAINSINNFLEKEAVEGNIWFKLDEAGNLNFQNSPFTKSQQENAIKKIVDEINQANPQGIAEIRALKRRLNSIYNEFASQFNKNTQLERVVNRMINSVDDALPSEFKAINKKYSEGINALSRIEELLLPITKTGEVRSSALGKVESFGKKEFQQLYPNFIKDFKEKTGMDLVHQIDIFNAAKEISPLAIKPESDISGPIRLIQKIINPIAGKLRLEIAKGNYNLLFNALNDVAKTSIEAKQAVQPIIEFIKNETVPTVIKLGIIDILSGEQEQEAEDRFQLRL